MMEARAGRTNKQQDRSLRAGAQPVQQLQKNAQNISGSVLNKERTLHELDAGRVQLWMFITYLLPVEASSLCFLQT